MKKFLLILFFSCTTFQAFPDDNVSAEYTYHASEQESPAEAKQTAVQRARIQALEDRYGRKLRSDNITDITNRDGKTSQNFIATSYSEVNGEWLRDTKEPEFEILFEENTLVIKVKVWGKAREIKQNAVDVDVAILRNGTNRKFESEEFNDGDQFYVAFKSPINGYVAIYYIDKETQDAFCLLPYSGDTEGQVSIAANREYIFFSPEMCPEQHKKALVDEILLPSGRNKKIDEIVIIFSHNSFFKALDNEYKSDEGQLPRGLKTKEFNEWLSKCRSKDSDMITVRKHITIAAK